MIKMLKSEGVERRETPFWRTKKFMAFCLFTAILLFLHFSGRAERVHYELYAFGIFAIGVSDGLYEKAKNRTNGRLVSGNMHFSLNTDAMANPGDLKIFSLGGIVHKYFLPQSGDEGTLVTRTELVEKLGENNYVIHGDIHEVEYAELPIAAKKEIESNKDFDEPYYMTRVPKYPYLNLEEVREKIENLMELEDTNEQLNRRINTLRRMNSMDFEDIEDFVETMKRITGESRTDKLLKRIGAKNEEKENV